MPVTLMNMGGEIDRMSTAEAASALAWWLESGVDVLVQDEPRDWLRPAPPPAAADHVAEDQSPIGTPANELPETLDLFRDWLANAPAPAFAATATRRVMPRGAENAAVMLMSDLPSSEDAAAGEPIGGAAQQLAERMLAAIGIKPEEAYFASLSCFHMPGARLKADELQACAELARRHVALAKPQRLLLLGDGPSRALTGKPVAQARGHVHRIEGVRAVATFSPRQLLTRPSDKALAWRDLLLLMEDEA